MTKLRVKFYGLFTCMHGSLCTHTCLCLCLECIAVVTNGKIPLSLNLSCWNTCMCMMSVLYQQVPAAEHRDLPPSEDTSATQQTETTTTQDSQLLLVGGSL